MQDSKTPDEDLAKKAASTGEGYSPRTQHWQGKRSEPRLVVDIAARLVLTSLRLELKGALQDVSPNGCQFRTTEKFPVGIYVRIEVLFHIQDEPIRIAGVTRALYDEYTVGIRFLDMTDRKRRQVDLLIAEVKWRRAEAAVKANAKPKPKPPAPTPIRPGTLSGSRLGR